MIDSVCWLPKVAMWRMAPSTPSTVATEITGARYSVRQSFSVAGVALGSRFCTSPSPRTSQPSSCSFASTGIRCVSSAARSTRRVSAAPQTLTRRILALATTSRAMAMSASRST